jgi:hypothetical protein
VTDNAPVERDVLAFARPRYIVAIVLETVLCFAMPCFLLCGGMLYLPIMLVALAGGAYGNPLPWMVVVSIVLGWTGVAGVGRVLWLVCARHPPPFRRALTLLCLACGVADALGVWFAITFRTSGGWAPLTGLVFVPLTCTAHLVYLARRRLFA